MKKRLRKKMCVGEFQTVGFDLSAEYGQLDEEALEKFVDAFMDKMEELGMYAGGSFEDGKIDLFVVSGNVQEDNEAKKAAITEFLTSQANVKDVKAGELVDANY